MKRFRDRKWHSHREETEANPLEFMANLADAMLILSVGFMLALVANWNIDISVKAQEQTVTVETDQALTFDENDMTKSEEDVESVSNGDMEKLGTVYFNSEDGKYYILEGKEDDLE